jgi:GT2 family glycosyltransferase
MNHIVVIVLTINQREKTLQCLTTICQMDKTAHRVLVWDNGSHDGTGEAIRLAFPDVFVHEHPINLGVASGRNAAAQLAIEMFRPSYLLFLDNDILVEPGFVAALHSPFMNNAKVGQTQAKLRFMADRARLNDAGGARINFILWQVTPVGYGEVDQEQHDSVKQCISCGGAMMVRTEIFQRLGGFDTQFDPFGPEDLDFSLRLQKAGYLALYVPQATAYHAVSHTFGKGYSEEYARHKSRHWLAFMRRHAKPWQKAGFYLIGLPYMGVRVLIREGRKGNWQAIKGILRGMFDYAKGSSRGSK